MQPDKKDIEKDFKGIEKYILTMPEDDDLDPATWTRYFKAAIMGVEAMGVTKIMLPTTREGHELTEGTLLDDIEPEKD